MFTRKEQAEAFAAAAYDSLPAFTTTLRDLGNFKEALPRVICVRTIPGLTKPRSFKLLRRGHTDVIVGLKEFMHSPI